MDKPTKTSTDEVKQYYKNYYHTYYKDIIKDKKCFCEICNIEVSSWNMYKHKQSNKHQFNLLSDDEKKDILDKKPPKYTPKRIPKTEEQLLEMKTKLEKKLNKLNKHLVNLTDI